MKRISCFVLGALLLLMVITAYATTKVAPNAVTLKVEYAWTASDKCSTISPEIKVSGIPAATKELVVTLTDLDFTDYPHGGGTVQYTVTNAPFTIPRGALKQYDGPCPPLGLHNYTIQVDAVDDKGVIVGTGKKTTRCCP
jgi:phosphatidylethanolamine-binding protein (PEBP) family uncharacterized protein